MISFRYHIVSIVSVFLALAVGVALGSGPLKGEVDNTLVDQVQADRQTKAALREEIGELRLAGRFSDDFAETIAPGLLQGTLSGRVVTLVVLPTAPQSEAEPIGEVVRGAGGSVGGVVRLGNDLLDVENRQLVDELGGQLLDGASGVSVPPDASGYERFGALLARAVGTSEAGGDRPDATSDSVLAGLSTAGLVSTEDDLDRRGDLVMFLAGDGSGGTEDRQGANTIATTVIGAMDADTAGAVVAGPMDSARAGGLVRTIRDDVVTSRDVSTVDTLGQAAARVVAVMALAGQANDQTGQFGEVDAADGAMPGAVPDAG